MRETNTVIPKYCTVLCTANCKHNDGENYYNVCKHPVVSTQGCYGGIDRVYKDGCNFKITGRLHKEED